MFAGGKGANGADLFPSLFGGGAAGAGTDGDAQLAALLAASGLTVPPPGLTTDTYGNPGYYGAPSSAPPAGTAPSSSSQAAAPPLPTPPPPGFYAPAPPSQPGSSFFSPASLADAGLPGEFDLQAFLSGAMLSVPAPAPAPLPPRSALLPSPATGALAMLHTAKDHLQATMALLEQVRRLPGGRALLSGVHEDVQSMATVARGLGGVVYG